MSSPVIGNDPSPSPGKLSLFPATRWTVILNACQSSPDALAALSELCQSYWYPLYAYLRRNGHRPEEAEDLTQEFFAQRVVTGLIFCGASPGGGRFRTWLLNSLQNLVRNEIDKRHAQKRGGGATHVPLDFQDAERRYCAEPATKVTPENLFERAWAFTLIERALDELRMRYQAAGKTDFFEAMRCYLPGALAPKPYAATAAALGKTEDSIKMAASRLRREYGAALTSEIERIVADPKEAQEELRYLLAVISR